MPAIFSKYMTQDAFYSLFKKELINIYNAVRYIESALPLIIDEIETQELKDALKLQWQQAKQQVQKLKQIFHALHEVPYSQVCEPMEDLINETNMINLSQPQPLIKEAAILAILQRIKHYEMACYGIVASFAKQLDFFDIANIIQHCEEEEELAEKKLASLAEGGMLNPGINQRAREE